MLRGIVEATSAGGSLGGGRSIIKEVNYGSFSLLFASTTKYTNGGISAVGPPGNMKLKAVTEEIWEVRKMRRKSRVDLQ